MIAYITSPQSTHSGFEPCEPNAPGVFVWYLHPPTHPVDIVLDMSLVLYMYCPA